MAEAAPHRHLHALSAPRRTTPITVVIATRDSSTRAVVSSALRAHRDFVMLASVERTAGLADAIRVQRPDVVFLDAQLARAAVAQVLKMLAATRLPAVVLISATRDLAADAFDVRAVDYLVQPLHVRRVNEAIRRAREHVLRERVFAIAEPLLQQFDPGARDEALSSRLSVRSGARMIFLRPDDIDWVESDHNHVRLYAGSRCYRVRKTIADVQTLLGEREMARIHRRILVRLSRVRELRLGPGWKCEAVLTGGRTLPVSRTYRTSLQRRLGRR